MKEIRNRLLGSLPASDLSLLRRHLRGVSIEQGQTLEYRGQSVERVYFPETGLISLIVATAEDAAIEVAMVSHEGAVGLTAGLGSRVSFVQALVQVSGTAWSIPLSRFQAAAARSPRIRAMIARYAEMTIGQVQQTAACNGLHDVASRVSRWLLHASDRIEHDAIPFTQEFLGEMLGVQRTTISQVMGKLREAGLIATHHGRIDILDRGGLKKQACECYEVIRNHIDRLFRA